MIFHIRGAKLKGVLMICTYRKTKKVRLDFWKLPVVLREYSIRMLVKTDSLIKDERIVSELMSESACEAMQHVE